VRGLSILLGSPARLMTTSFVIAGLVLAAGGEASYVVSVLATALIWALLAAIFAVGLGAVAAGLGVFETDPGPSERAHVQHGAADDT
jgi:hypothetical protein